MRNTINMEPLKVLERIELAFVSRARRLGMNGLWLREIIACRCRGLNMGETARRIGTSRETVSKYLETLGELEHEDFVILFNQAVLLKSGMLAMDKLLSILMNVDNWNPTGNRIETGDESGQVERMLCCPVALDDRCEAPRCTHKTPHLRNRHCRLLLTDCRHGNCACIPAT